MITVTGYWAQDKKNGSGRYKYANGDMYHGEWKDDVKHGFGMYLFEENMSQVCAASVGAHAWSLA